MAVTRSVYHKCYNKEYTKLLHVSYITPSCVNTYTSDVTLIKNALRKDVKDISFYCTRISSSNIIIIVVGYEVHQV